MKRASVSILIVALTVVVACTDSQQTNPSTNNKSDSSSHSQFEPDVQMVKPTDAPGCPVGEVQEGTNGDGTPDCVPDESGGGGASGGGDTGPSTGGGASGGGSSTVASYAPASGDTCGGSDHALGETWPPGSEPASNTTNNIVNITEITEPAPNGGQVVVAWDYVTAGGQNYVEENGHQASAWANLISNLPPLGTWNSAVDNANVGALVPSSVQDVNALYSTEKGMGGAYGSCFTHPLTYA